MSANIIAKGSILSNRRVSTPILLIVLAVACLAVYFAARQFFPSVGTVDSASSGGLKATPAVNQNGVVQPQSAAHQRALATPVGSFAQRTYQPGKPHAVRQLTASVDRQNKSSAWWIHPKTEEEARWMDTYGYPTASEEERLRSASLADLKALADAGDLNAKAHFLGRSFVTDFEKGDVKSRNLYTGQVEYLLTDGGPYQATTFIQYYGQLLSAYAALPEEQRTGKWAQNVQDLGTSFKFAELQLKMLGDEVGMGVRTDVFAQAGGYFQASMINLPGDSLATSIAVNARRRAERGEPPLVIVPRPKQPPGDSSFYLERYK
jgi:hypothetical protein